MRNRGVRALSAAALALALVGVAAQAEVGRATDATLAGPMAHIRALQDIADANGGNRAAGTAGYDRSADYVAERLRGAGYAVRFEDFTFPFFEERSPPVLALTPMPAAAGEAQWRAAAARALSPLAAGTGTSTIAFAARSRMRACSACA